MAPFDVGRVGAVVERPSIGREDRLRRVFDQAVRRRKQDVLRTRIGARIVTLHIADNDGKDERHWLPGNGVNDWIAISRALQQTGYRGLFLFECDGIPEETIAVWNRIKVEASVRSRCQESSAAEPGLGNITISPVP